MSSGAFIYKGRKDVDVYNCLEPSNEALIYDFGLKIGDIFVEDFYGKAFASGGIISQLKEKTPCG